MKHALRSFGLGFVPTLCLWALAAGLLAVWLNTQSVLTPAAVPVALEETAPWTYALEVFGEELAFRLPPPPDKLEFFSEYPVLIPRGLRLLAWGWEELPGAVEYLKGLLPY